MASPKSLYPILFVILSERSESKDLRFALRHKGGKPLILLLLAPFFWRKGS